MSGGGGGGGCFENILCSQFLPFHAIGFSKNNPQIKFQNPRTTPSGRKVTQAGRKKDIEKTAQKEHRGF
jgi:hypothetical protein